MVIEFIFCAMLFFTLGRYYATIKAVRKINEIKSEVIELDAARTELEEAQRGYITELEKSIKFYQDVENYSYSRN